MGKKLAIEHHLIRPNEVIELLEMMGGKNTDNADGCSFLYYTLCTPKINNPNNDKVICGFTNLKMQNDHFAIFTLEKFWKKYPYKLNDLVLCDDGLLGIVTKMEWDCEKSDMKYHISFKTPVYNKWYSSKNIICKFMEVKSKTLGIKGHQTRGKEVIELLEMMGGEAIAAKGYDEAAIYVIPVNGIIDVRYTYEKRIDNYAIFTLEEFLEKYPFKVGDKVVYTKFGDNCDDYPVTIESMKWTGTTIEYTFNDCVTCLAKDLKMWNGEPDAVISGIYLNSCDYADEVELNLGDYEIEVRDGRTFAVLKKPEYPKTYKECCDVLGINTMDNDAKGYKHFLVIQFQELLIARDAYWKIAGEQMGLGKPWEPDWNWREYKFCIGTIYDEIEKFHAGSQNCMLAFPTEEMRDAFYENFKDLIENCKELL